MANEFRVKNGIVTGGDILPDADNSHDLGTSTYQFKDLHLQGNIDLGNAIITDNSIAMTTGAISFTPSTNDTITLQSATNGAFSITTVDTAGTAANVSFVVDGEFSVATSSYDDIILDAGGGDVWFKDGGTSIGALTNSSSDFVVRSVASDQDLIFKGSDGGVGITALTLDMSEAGAATFGGGIADAGTISAGTWQGTAIASAYLDSDTAHLSGTQTFSGTKTFSSTLLVAGEIQHSGDTNNSIAFGTDTQTYETGGTTRLDISDSGVMLGGSGARVTTILDEDAMGSNSATALVTQQSLVAYVASEVGSAGGGDITAVVAGVGLSGGATSGSATLTLDMSELTDMTADVNPDADEFILLDGSADRRKMMNEIDVGGFRDIITGPFGFETDQENVALGEGALDSLTQYVSGIVLDGGSNNTALGENAGTAVSTGDSNTLLGHDAGETILAGSSNTIVGADAEPSANSASNQIVIGKGAVGLADNSVVLGNTNITAWLPPDDAGVDLGSSSYQFKDGYFHGTLEADAITVNGTATAVSGGAFHDGFSDFVANEHIDHSGVTITAGTGMTGGGTIAATRTLNVIGGTGITANANDIAIDSTVATLSGSQTLTNKTIAASQVTEISNLTAVEGAQLENIGSVTISNAQWGYLGAATGAITNTDTNTQNEYATSFVDSTNDVLLRLTESGAGSGTQDIKFVAGTNITLTPSGANMTIAASGGSGGISNVVEDTSPQLGGDLDTNSQNIQFDDAHGIHDDSGNEMLIFGKTTSATSYIKLWNSIADSTSGTLFGTDVVGSDTAGGGRMTGPGIEATGSETDIGLAFKTKGLGHFIFVNDDSTSAAAPVLNLARKHSGEADDDVIGLIKFTGMDSSPAGSDVEDLRDYAKIECTMVDVTDGSVDGQMIFSTLVGDSHKDLMRVGVHEDDDNAAGVALYRGMMIDHGSSHTLTEADEAGCYVRATAAITLTLPGSPAKGEQYVVISDHAGTTTISADGSDTMNGSTDNQTITTRYEAKTFIAVSTSAWIVIG